MVCPVRIKIPPLLKVLQTEEKKERVGADGKGHPDIGMP
jgi:hypothetical protein